MSWGKGCFLFQTPEFFFLLFFFFCRYRVDAAVDLMSFKKGSSQDLKLKTHVASCMEHVEFAPQEWFSGSAWTCLKCPEATTKKFEQVGRLKAATPDKCLSFQRGLIGGKPSFKSAACTKWVSVQTLNEGLCNINLKMSHHCKGALGFISKCESRISDSVVKTHGLLDEGWRFSVIAQKSEVLQRREQKPVVTVTTQILFLIHLIVSLRNGRRHRCPRCW